MGGGQSSPASGRGPEFRVQNTDAEADLTRLWWKEASAPCKASRRVQNTQQGSEKIGNGKVTRLL